MEQATNNGPIEVVYKKPKMSKRFFSYFIDVSLFLLSTFILFSINNMIVTSSGWYKNKGNELNQLRNDSGLFVDGKDIITYTSDNTEFPTYEEKKSRISSAIDDFYHNTTYITDTSVVLKGYDERRLNAKVDGTNLFVKSGETVVENTVTAEVLYNFYKDEVSNYTMALLVKYPQYFYLTRFSFLTSIVQIVAIGMVMFTVFYLVLPLTCFKRGRQTIGMKLSNIGLISVWADNVTTGKYVGRFFFELGVFFFLNFFSFLIPTFVSIGMVIFTKSNSSLVNYVFNDYCVDITNQKIYYDALERSESSIKLQDMSIENKDLRLK